MNDTCCRIKGQSKRLEPDSFLTPEPNDLSTTWLMNFVRNFSIRGVAAGIVRNENATSATV